MKRLMANKRKLRRTRKREVYKKLINKWKKHWLKAMYYPNRRILTKNVVMKNDNWKNKMKLRRLVKPQQLKILKAYRN